MSYNKLGKQQKNMKKNNNFNFTKTRKLHNFSFKIQWKWLKLVIKIAVRKVPTSGFHKMLYLASLFKMDQQKYCDKLRFADF